MKSGIQLVQSFEIVGETLENLPMRELVGQIRDDVAAVCKRLCRAFIRKLAARFPLCPRQMVGNEEEFAVLTDEC